MHTHTLLGSFKCVFPQKTYNIHPASFELDECLESSLTNVSRGEMPGQTVKKKSYRKKYSEEVR